MDESELVRSHELLGVSPGCGLEDLARAFAQKEAMLQHSGGELEREKLRLAHNAVAAHLRAKLRRQTAVAMPAGNAPTGAGPTAVCAEGPGSDFSPREAEVFPLFAFDNGRVNLVVPPLLLGFVWLLNVSPLGFLLRGFQVWMHEFGHATAAWMTGRRATPLPFGWTPVEPEYSHFVYFGLLLMFGLLFAAGWKERKVWPMATAVALAILQFYMTWRMTELQQEFWWGAFGGVGGEFYLGALLMAFFYVELPEKFRWGLCRYVFFVIGATSFLHIVGFWDEVYRGLEDIPFGTMINGEDDQGGDMNKLMDAFHWTHSDIRQNYHLLGRYCWIGLGAVYAVFALRLNRIPDKIVEWFNARQHPESGR